MLPKVSTHVVRRAAFDIGSGATKLAVADVDIQSGFISKYLFGQERPCAYGSDWLKSQDGSLSTKIQTTGLQTITDLKSIAENLGATSYSAIATEVFRKSVNGQSFINKMSTEINVPIQIVSQEMEAELGYATGVALQATNSIEMNPSRKCKVWDSGGASFQITFKDSISIPSPNLQYYIGAFGSGISMKILIETIQNRILSEIKTPNPVSRSDSEALISSLLQRLPSEVPIWLQSSTVVAIGGPNSMFSIAMNIINSLKAQNSEMNSMEATSVSSPRLNKTVFTSIDVQYAIKHCVEKSDAELSSYTSYAHADPPSLIIPKLALLYAVMIHANIEQVEFLECIGSCPGLLISNEYWTPDTDIKTALLFFNCNRKPLPLFATLCFWKHSSVN
eukprot:gene9696-20155_t